MFAQQRKSSSLKWKIPILIFLALMAYGFFPTAREQLPLPLAVLATWLFFGSIGGIILASPSKRVKTTQKDIQQRVPITTTRVPVLEADGEIIDAGEVEYTVRARLKIRLGDLKDLKVTDVKMNKSVIDEKALTLGLQEKVEKKIADETSALAVESPVG